MRARKTGSQSQRSRNVKRDGGAAGGGEKDGGGEESHGDREVGVRAEPTADSEREATNTGGR